MPRTFTLHLGDGPHELVLADGDAGEIWLANAALRELTGWKLEARGLCRDEACVPRSLLGAGVREDAVELTALARAIGAELEIHPGGASATLRPRGPGGR